MAGYRVVAPFVTVDVPRDDVVLRHLRIAGRVGLVAGNVLPDGVPADQLDHLLAHGLIEPVPEG